MGKIHLYKNGMPCLGFNEVIVGWLNKSLSIYEHRPPAAFDSLRCVLDMLITINHNDPFETWEGLKNPFSNLTNIMLSIDLQSELALRLSSKQINATGFRTILSQSAAKNAGENFINAIVYGLAKVLSFQDEILVDKGLTPALTNVLRLRKDFTGRLYGSREIILPIEGDLVIYSRSNPFNAIIVNAKTRLKEVFHIGTMWKIIFDMFDDEYCLGKWGLSRSPDTKHIELEQIQYVFITADMISETGANSQGSDVDRDEVRNLIAADASFFDYAFVSKSNINHVSKVLDFEKGREALFHELGCLLDLIRQKFHLFS